MTNTQVRISGYHVSEQLYNGSRTLVYRGYKEQNQQPVVIKLLKNPYPSFTELLSFCNQYTIARNLNVPGIIQTYSLETYQNGYALVMEDFGGISLKQWRSVPSLMEFLLLAIALCNILDVLIRHRIIHKDIKPANILINPETGDIKLIDFSIASLLPRETQSLKSLNVLEGTLGYLSPEQTGRMNRGIDYRTDFYSLGVTFYELLTGKLPFPSNDPMELVHCHIAKLPPLMHEINPEIAPTLSEIVMKLMAKNAEDRYQSAFGLKYDLETCLRQLQQTGKIASFAIGQRDVSDRFIIPEKLYGREEEVKTLLAAFDRVTNHQMVTERSRSTELMLVAGFSGIGKTAIINEVHKPIVEQQGYFIKGKFDQFNRNIPFSAFVQTFRDLMRQLLSENDTQLLAWKTKILTALGDNGQVIVEVIPELEQIIGHQPPAPNLSGTAAQNRFNLLFQKFIQVFTTKEHPLVIFLDDLQWADSASLKLMQLLMDESEVGYLLLIGAYRDNEVSAAHPLMLTLEEIAKAKVTINIITLAPLSAASLNQLVADTLSCSPEVAQPLTQLVYQKTKGNPFFSTQFLKALYEDGLIQFDFDGGTWQCDIPQVQALALTDDVVEFMALQLQKLPTATQDVLKLAACIGNEFDLASLAIAGGASSNNVSETSEAETATALWKALQEGLILPQTEVYKFYIGQEIQTNAQQISQAVTYKFLHDRVQQAAYFLIPEEEKQTTHLKLGQLLLNNISASEQQEKIFQIVSQLNMGLGLITHQTERNQVAQLNLVAGCKAKASTAYTAAVEYLTLGIELLAVDSWQNQYDLTLALYEEAAEAEYLNTHFEQAISLADLILQQTTHLLDKIKTYELKVQIYIAQDQQVQAIETGLKALEQLKISLILPGVEQKNYLKPLPELTNLANIPEMSNPESLAALRLLISITPPVHHVKPEMFPSVALTMLHLCLEQGHSSLAAFVYGIYGLFLSAVIGDVDTAYHSGQISLELLEQYHAKEISSKIYMLFGAFICAFKEHGRNTIQLLREGMQCGLEVGDIEYASYSMMAECKHLFLIGEPLNSVDQRQAKYIDLLLNFKQKHCVDYAQIWRQLTLNFLGQTSDQFHLTGIDFDETEMLLHFHKTHNHQSLFAIYVAKTIVLYNFQKYEQAVTNAEQATEFVDGAFGPLIVAGHNFYYSLSLLAQYSECDSHHQERCLNQVAANQKLMGYWADHARANYQHKYDLVAAETARVMGDPLKAMEYYDRAIAVAKENGYLNEEALSNELAAKFYLNWGKEKVAQAYLQEAYYCYALWDAKAKIDDLETRYPQLLQTILQQKQFTLQPLETLAIPSRTIHQPTQTSSSSSTSISEALDFATILKVSQSLSSEIQLDKLLQGLLNAIMTNAGASKCVLMLMHDNDLLIEAIAQLGQEPSIGLALPIDQSFDVPISLIYIVKRSLQSLVIDDARTEASLVADFYITKHQPKSLLCHPIVHQGKLLGILYLENNLATEAFTADRLEIVKLLSSQAAISLENANLYNTLEEKVSDRTQQLSQALEELKTTQDQLVESKKMAALGSLVAGVAHEVNTPVGTSITLVSTLIDKTTTLITTVEQGQLKRADLTNYLNIAKECGDIILTNLNSAAELVQSFKQVAVDQTNLEQRTIKVKLYLEETLFSLAPNLRKTLHTVTITGDDTVTITSYPGALAQVATNLVMNSLMHAYQPEETGEMHFQVLKQGDQAIIQYRDDGCGVPEEHLSRIFEPFFTTARHRGGTGLGLHIVYNLVTQKLRGTINVQSQVGMGTLFIVTLPLEPQVTPSTPELGMSEYVQRKSNSSQISH
ncbi:ATP-binding sensor histidine kinase [Calothrix sp. PCC 7507]|uniref:trifunctional serine/threonine-protein kinase/ATP-binding protein/sensor histidine kinase n=1 Tax=Calothrix sp. PCC 7507 TaxID=99598 RepID=UPI00029F4A2B|nr:ATP-binding sensor histidine kinase [Calothrix sp. PCC 7507]AFY35505.1 multi-sensor signal transduction multi-kinase [Calothrix sp. PCC 7507]